MIDALAAVAAFVVLVVETDPLVGLESTPQLTGTSQFAPIQPAEHAHE